MKLPIRILLILIVAGAGFGLFLHWSLHYRNTELDYPQHFDIKPGESLNDLLSDLQSRGLIRFPLGYKIYARLYPDISHIKAGEYVLDSALSGYQLLTKLRRGEVHHRRITIAEGSRLREIITLLDDSLGIPADTLWSIEHQPEKLRAITGLDITSLEGYLYPETYFFSKFQSYRDVITAMTDLFKQRILPIWEQRPPDFKLSLNETLTLASIIEKETSIRSELSLVSSVYHNRLKQRMKLQACPTVQYSLPHNKRLYEKDLLNPSPYNTYRYEGLPPGLICSPSPEAFQAAIHPAETEYLFFVAGSDHHHLFSKTFNEHTRKNRQTKISRSAP